MFRLTNHLFYLACGGVILLVAQFACAKFLWDRRSRSRVSPH